jgi:hypothetical protein
LASHAQKNHDQEIHHGLSWGICRIRTKKYNNCTLNNFKETIPASLMDLAFSIE